MGQVRIKSIADFLDVPDDEIAACLSAFRLYVLRCKDDRRVAEGNGFPRDSIPVEGFCWNPREHLGDSTIKPEGTTPLDDLPLRHSVKHALRAMNVFCLEDFSQVSEREFYSIRDVGALTVEKIKALLASIGLRFKPSDNPEALLREQNKVARKVLPTVRLAAITDASSIAELGLTPGTFNRAREKGHSTAGALRALSIRDIAFDYGKRQGLEILDTLSMAGLPLTQAPTQTALWRHGFLSFDQLVLPTDPLAPLHEYSPWIGNALVERIQDRGVATLPQLVALLGSERATSIPGIGKKTHAKLLSFLAGLEQGAPAGLHRRNAKPSAPKASETSNAQAIAPTWLETVPN